MFLVGFVFAAVSVPLSPPSGPFGWPGVAGFMVTSLVLGG